MKVFVLSPAKTPLMSTTPGRARRWLKQGRARVIHREPFTIQLLFATTTYTQAVAVGVDTGSQTVGIAAVTNGEAVYQAEVHLRNDISQKLLQRRQYRRNRRWRKTRYRPARFANRRRRAGWLPPSLRSKAEATLKVVYFVASIVPVTQINVEVGSFDTQKMQNPEIQGQEYQQGQVEGYHLREYLLYKWHHKCVYCGVSETQLQIEHLIPRSRGGSDRASNLAIACEACNLKKGNQTAAEFGFPEVQVQARTPLKDAAHVSSIKTWVLEELKHHFGSERVQSTYGYETKYKRIQVLHLPKSHTNDAIAIACAVGEVVQPAASIFHHRCVPHGNYQLYNGVRSEHKVWAAKKLRGWKLYELIEAKGVVGYIGGRRIQGAFVMKVVATGKGILEVTPRKLRRLARPWKSWIVARQSLVRKEERASSPA